MKVVYIAGPYTGANEWETHGNIMLAEDRASRLWLAGIAAVCPHKNTAWMGGLVPYERFIEGDLAILRRCDAVLTCPGWRDSNGAQMEVQAARDRGMPIFHSVEEAVRGLIGAAASAP